MDLSNSSASPPRSKYTCSEKAILTQVAVVRQLTQSHRGAGGMFDTRDPEPFQDEDPRKSISEAPSFEEYLKQRQAGGQ